ncbi:MAG: nucleotide exchange factor GrpE [Muribaculaceae bacterium]|nr:nucleotide exchange factor GrpE [Muribaculaceae bacterium]
MNKKQNNDAEKEFTKENNEVEVNDEQQDIATEVAEETENAENLSELESLKQMLQQREEAIEQKDKEYLFLMAEFDNFRKRTVREKAEIIKNGAENVLKGILPIIDDFERGIKAMNENTDAKSVKEGIEMIYNKFIKFLQQNGVNEIASEDAAFDVDLHEAIAMVPVEDESKKGKVIDTITKGYTLNDKVIRHAKVAVGQ